jgi:transcriptional regulator with XRE-family HTH domain
MYTAGMLDTERIKARRAELGLSQEAAAARAGLKGRQAWSNIESGYQDNVTLETLGKVAKALEVYPAELLKAEKPKGKRKG